MNMRYKEIFENVEKTGDDYFNMTKHDHVYNDRSRETLVYMSPKDFLTLAEDDYDQSKMDGVKEIGNANIKFSSLPSLSFEHDGKGTARVQGHEGRHRARYLMSKGVDKMPVLLLSLGGHPGKGIRWGIAHDPDRMDYIKVMPKRIISQNGLKTLPMPQSHIYPRNTD